MATDEFQLAPGGGIEVEQQIRWGDLDALGHVNNTIFFQFCESARIAYFAALGLERFKERPTDGPGIVTATLNFRQQLHYPGRVKISARTTRVGGKSYTLAYEIRDAATGTVAADGESVCVWVDYAAGRAMPLPAALVEAMAQIDQSRVD